MFTDIYFSLSISSYIFLLMIKQNESSSEVWETSCMTVINTPPHVSATSALTTPSNGYFHILPFYESHYSSLMSVHLTVIIRLFRFL